MAARCVTPETVKILTDQAQMQSLTSPGTLTPLTKFQEKSMKIETATVLPQRTKKRDCDVTKSTHSVILPAIHSALTF